MGREAPLKLVLDRPETMPTEVEQSEKRSESISTWLSAEPRRIGWMPTQRPTYKGYGIGTYASRTGCGDSYDDYIAGGNAELLEALGIE